MASERYKEIQALSIDELKVELAESLKKYQDLKFDHVLSGIENPLSIRVHRRDIARLKTELTQRQKHTVES